MRERGREGGYCGVAKSTTYFIILLEGTCIYYSQKGGHLCLPSSVPPPAAGDCSPKNEANTSSSPSSNPYK